MSASVRPQFSQTMRMPALRAAGMAVRRRCWDARLPGLEKGRPSGGERKKFCMSNIRSAVVEGVRMMVLVLVGRESEVLGEGRG